jgi:hypothetical protein
LYLKRIFYIPLKAALKGSHINIDVDLLNSKVFSWLELANSRIHDTTKEKPINLLKEEKTLLVPFYKSVKKIKEVKTKINKIDLSDLNMDIAYHT